jgi:hypothetical protein
MACADRENHKLDVVRRLGYGRVSRNPTLSSVNTEGKSVGFRSATRPKCLTKVLTTDVR